MTIDVQPQIGVPWRDDIPYIELKARAEAACNAAFVLNEHGFDLHVDAQTKDEAAALVTEYAEDPQSTTRKVNDKRMTHLRPASLLLVDQVLHEFGHSVAENASAIRNLVTNKLLIESENQDPRIRMRALELLGKISDVGLFAEKSDVTIRNKTTDDIRERLRSKLSKLQSGDEVAEDAVVIDVASIDVDKTFGLVDD